MVHQCNLSSLIKLIALFCDIATALVLMLGIIRQIVEK